MNLNHLEAIAHVQRLAFALAPADFDAADVVVLPPFTNLRSVQTVVDADRLRLRYGAQDLSPYDSGAHTGDVSGAQLAKLGCTFVVVGHSERRQRRRIGNRRSHCRSQTADRKARTARAGRTGRTGVRPAQ